MLKKVLFVLVFVSGSMVASQGNMWNGGSNAGRTMWNGGTYRPNTGPNIYAVPPSSTAPATPYSFNPNQPQPQQPEQTDPRPTSLYQARKPYCVIQ